MKGSKREKAPGVWELRVYLGRDPVSGRIRQRSRTYRGGTRGADDALAKLLVDTRGERAPATEGSFAYVLDRWLTTAEPSLARRTAREYRRIADVMLVPVLGDVPLRKLKGHHFDELYAQLRRRGLKESSIMRVHAVARRCCNEAIRWEWLTVSPVAKAKAPSPRKATVRVPTLAEVAAIIEAAPGDLRTLLWVAVASGARRGELVGLRWSNVDLESGELRIAEAVVDIAGELMVKDTKTHQERRLRLDEVTLERLRAHRVVAEAGAVVDAPGGVLRPDAFVFSAEPDGSVPLKPGQITRAWTRARDRVELPGVRFHDLRHLNASLLLSSKVDLATVSARHGHAQQSTTQNIYSHSMPGSDDEAAAIMGRLLG